MNFAAQICECFLLRAGVFDPILRAKCIQHNSTPPIQPPLSYIQRQSTRLSNGIEELLQLKLSQLGITVSALLAIS